MNRIEKKFKELKKQNKKAFITFITAGYPTLKITKKLLFEFSRIGIDIVELGVSFSDPLADGPIIQESSQAALENNVHLIDILNLVKKVRQFLLMPICLMTYYNPIFCFGEEKFLKLASAFGVDGVIIPDLPPEEGRAFIKLANKYKLDVICFISPTTSQERIKYISGIAKGFIYYVSLTGVTGPRQLLPIELIDNLKAIKKITEKPICVGFGISGPKQVKQIYKSADGAIVGSAIVKKIKENIGKPDLIKRVSNFVCNLRGK
jgi:tryptophan synthase alpha chain